MKSVLVVDAVDGVVEKIVVFQVMNHSKMSKLTRRCAFRSSMLHLDRLGVLLRLMMMILCTSFEAP